MSLGGQQTQLLNLAREFRSLGHEVVWSYETGDHLLTDINHIAHLVKIPSLPSFLSSNIPLLSSLESFLRLLVQSLIRFSSFRRIFQQYSIDILLVSDSYSSLIFGLSSIYPYRHLRLIGQDIERLERPWFRLYRFLNIDRYVTMYFGWDLPYRSLASIGVSPSKFAKFPSNAVDSSQFFPLPSSIVSTERSMLGIPSDSLVIGWVGRLEPRMQVSNTIHVCSRLLALGITKFHLLIVGGGICINGVEDTDYPNRLVQQCSSLGLSNHVTFTGWVPHQQLNVLYNVMDIVPLLESDPQGGSLIREAMACGKLTISVRGVSGTQSSFMPPNASILLDSSNYLDLCAHAIYHLFHDRALLAKYCSEARRHALENLSLRQQAISILSSH